VRNRRQTGVLVVLMLVISVVCGCSEATPEVVEVTRVVEVTATATEEPTATPPPEPTATKTPAPTLTPRPTFTRGPTRTPLPTPTPTPMPETIVYEGSGDDVLDLDYDEDRGYFLYISGNDASRHFDVWSVDGSNNKIDLLVNTSDPYRGWHGFDMTDEGVVRLLITAVGPWEVRMIPAAPIPEAQEHLVEVPPGVFEGEGDNILVLVGDEPDVMSVVSNAMGRHFDMWSYGDSGRDLLVNTSDPYDGRVLLGPGTSILEIHAVGPWTIEIEGK